MSRSMALMYGNIMPPKYPKDHKPDCECRSCQTRRALENPVFEGATMEPCSKCKRHIRINEHCPWCMSEAVSISVAALTKAQTDCSACKRKDAALAVSETIRENLKRNIAKAEAEWQKLARRARDAEAELRVRKKGGKSSGR